MNFKLMDDSFQYLKLTLLFFMIFQFEGTCRVFYHNF